MSNSATIMIVDDAAENRLILQTVLEDDYELQVASSGEDCLQQVEKSTPNLILLDVDMPEMSGYEVCAQLRQQEGTRNVPVIFVSALVSTEDRLAGFEAGGDEYVTKPIDSNDLLKKIKHRLEHHIEISTAKKQSSEAMNVAMEAMTSSNEYAKIVNFCKILNETATPESVGEAFCQISNDFGLTVCVLMTTPKDIYLNCETDSNEAKVMQQFKIRTERLTCANTRALVKNDNFVALIRNMPIENENLFGRLKDHLAVLVDLANNRLLNLSFQNALEQKRQALLNHIILLTEKQMKLVSGKLHRYDETVQNNMQDMVNKLENMLFSLGLEEDQETTLMRLVDETSEKLGSMQRNTGELDDQLGIVLVSLYDLLEKEAS